MKIKDRGSIVLLLLGFAMLFSSELTPAVEVPKRLPDPDGKPGDATKPVKVYLLAGQSNMVGMGDLGGAKCRYSGIYLSADPAASLGPMYVYPVGHYKIAPLGIHVSADPQAKPGATASIYAGDFNQDVDYDKAEPTRIETIALGVAEGELPSVAGPHTVVVRGFIEVPESGGYTLGVGYGESSYNATELDRQEVYRKEPGGKAIKQEITLEAGERYPITITYFRGGSTALWMRREDLVGKGDLETVTKRDKKFPWLIDDAGDWTVRRDVYYQDARLNFKGSPLSATSNGKSIGPELGFGHVLGTYHDEQVLLIKTAQGNRSLGFDFRPPSSGRTDPDSQWESLEYKLMVEGVRKILDDIENVVPGYQGQGYEIAGFAWWQGHKDAGATQAEYEQHLVNLITDLRREFQVPKMPAVVATVGFGGNKMSPEYRQILNAQLAVSDPKQHPELAGTVASVDIRDFWREPDDSPTEQGYHYNRNAETYMLVGDSLGRAMVDLLEGSQREPVVYAEIPAPQPDEPAAAEEASEDELLAARAALQPIVMDGMTRTYIEDPKNNAALLTEASGERPDRVSQFLRGPIYRLTSLYRTAGIDDYDWHLFGPDLRTVEWEYYSFDPPETMPADKGNRYREVTYPAGMENWVAPDFDAAAVGWKRGLPPFGQLDGELMPLSETCNAPFCGCGEKPHTLWEKEVLLVRGTFEFPPLKDDYRYRIVVGGSAHVNSGEGYAVYVNGRLLAESNTGVAVRQGGQPRGCHIYNDFRDEFRGGKVTIAATSFLRYNHPRIKPYPPRGHLTLWVEEAKIPPVK